MLAWLVVRGMEHNGGKWVYPLDDVYGHMAVAKQFARHGVWGISSLNGFSSCASSLFYPLLLAVFYALFGVNEMVPLVLNLLAAAALVYYTAAVLQRYTRSNIHTFIILGLAVIFTPLFVVAATGMEHVWQILVGLFFLDLAARVLAEEEPAPSARRAGWLLPLASCLAVMIRFEALFIVAIVGLLLLCRGRFWLAVSVGVGAALPLGIFGAYSLSKGWSFLPASVLLKGGAHSLGWFYLLLVAAVFAGLRWPRYSLRALLGAFAFIALIASLPQSRAWIAKDPAYYREMVGTFGHLVIIVAVMAAAFYWELQRQRTFWTRSTLLLCMLLVVALQHMAFASVGWVYRYEAYLMFLSVVVVGIALIEAYPELSVAWLRRQPPRWSAAWICVLLVVCLPLTKRVYSATWKIPLESHNIYEQQYQMARFVRRFYDHAGVAANDIGSIDYYADIRLVDTWGLATYEVFKARRENTYNQEVLRRLIAKYDVQLIVGYESWAKQYGGILPEWVLVGRWTIPNNLICGSDTVSFYAPDAREVPRLTRALQAFAPDLPGDVEQSGTYQDAAPPSVTQASAP